MKKQAEALFDLTFTKPNLGGLVEFIERGDIRSTEDVPNIFEGMTMNELFFFLSKSEVVAPEYRSTFAEMAKIAVEACHVEEELDHDTREAVTKRLRTLRS